MGLQIGKGGFAAGGVQKMVGISGPWAVLNQITAKAKGQAVLGWQ